MRGDRTFALPGVPAPHGPRRTHAAKHGRVSSAAVALMASLLAGYAPARAADGPAAAALSDFAAPAAAEVTVLGAAIVQRPAPPESLRAGHASGTAWRRFALSPHGVDRCEYFLVIEASGARFAMNTQDQLDAYMVSNGVAVMKNLDPEWAVGAGVQFHWATGNIKLAPEVRVRRWFDREQSVEAAFGWLLGTRPAAYRADFFEQVGPIASLRYSPRPWVFVQAGAARYRELPWTYAWPLYESGGARETTEVFAGIGFTGKGALVALGGEAVAFAALIVAFAGMD